MFLLCFASFIIAVVCDVCIWEKRIKDRRGRRRRLFGWHVYLSTSSDKSRNNIALPAFPYSVSLSFWLYLFISWNSQMRFASSLHYYIEKRIKTSLIILLFRVFAYWRSGMRREDFRLGVHVWTSSIFSFCLLTREANRHTNDQGIKKKPKSVSIYYFFRPLRTRKMIKCLCTWGTNRRSKKKK